MAKRALSWKRAAAIGWRDLKSAPGKFGFVVLSVAVGVAALVGVRGLSDSFRQSLSTEARSLLAGDLSARMFHAPTPEEASKIAAIASPKQRNSLHVDHRDDLDGLRAAGPGAAAGFAQGRRSRRVSLLRNRRPGAGDAVAAGPSGRLCGRGG